MQVRGSPAAADLEQIVEYIRNDRETAAQLIAQAIYERGGALATFPKRGREGRVPGTRELPLPPLPFIIVYRVIEAADAVEIINNIHGAQRWPPAE